MTAITYASGDPDRETARLRKALLALASQTPDNLAAIDRIKVIGADNGLSVVIGQAEIPIVDLAWTFESIPLPDGIAMDHPELDREDWDAFTRFLSLALIAMTPATDTGG